VICLPYCRNCGRALLYQRACRWADSTMILLLHFFSRTGHQLFPGRHLWRRLDELCHWDQQSKTYLPLSILMFKKCRAGFNRLSYIQTLGKWISTFRNTKMEFSFGPQRPSPLPQEKPEITTGRNRRGNAQLPQITVMRHSLHTYPRDPEISARIAPNTRGLLRMQTSVIT